MISHIIFIHFPGRPVRNIFFRQEFWTEAAEIACRGRGNLWYRKRRTSCQIIMITFSNWSICYYFFLPPANPFLWRKSSEQIEMQLFHSWLFAWFKSDSYDSSNETAPDYHCLTAGNCGYLWQKNKIHVSCFTVSKKAWTCFLCTVSIEQLKVDRNVSNQHN